jgi:hypothetical protein
MNNVDKPTNGERSIRSCVATSVPAKSASVSFGGPPAAGQRPSLPSTRFPRNVHEAGAKAAGIGSRQRSVGGSIAAARCVRACVRTYAHIAGVCQGKRCIHPMVVSMQF